MSKGIKGFVGSRSNSSVPQQTRTLQGGNAYTLDLEEKLCHMFTLGLINGNFFKNQETVVKETREVLEQALKDMPYIATQYAVYAAEELGMKLLPTIWLVYVSTLEDKSLFKSAFPRIINNPKMLYDFAELSRKAGIRRGFRGNKNGVGQSVKKTINNWLYENLNEYNTTRYTGKLEDVANLSRPEDKVVTRQGKTGAYDVNVGQFFKYMFKQKGQPRRLTFDRARAQDKVISDLQSGIVNEDTLLLISQYKFQLEELKFTFDNLSADQKKTVFMHFVPGLRYNALVSNLVAIERAFATRMNRVQKIDPDSGKYYPTTEVMETQIPKELIDIVSKKLQNFEDFKASKMLYFGLLTAHEMTITPAWRRALQEVLKKSGSIAFASVPANTKVRVSADTSGSMSTLVTNSLQAVDIAAYLAAGIGMSIPGSRTYATATTSKEVRLVRDNIIDNAVDIKKTSVGHGTSFETLLNDYAGEQYVILVSDGQDSGNMEAKWANLKKPNGAKLVIWHVAGHTYFNKISKRSDVIYLKGYSDQVLKVLANIIAGKSGQPDVVRSIKL
ncbi:TROVE domain protein [compost metagenome]